MEETVRFRQLIEMAFPQLDIRRIVFLGAGWDSTTVLVNDELVFRFPRRADVARAIEVERCLMPSLAPRLPLPIPRFDFVAEPLPGYPWRFVGYRALPGRPMAEMPASNLCLEQIGRALGAFVRALHDAPVELAERCAAVSYTPEGWVERHWQLAQDTLPIVERALGEEPARRLQAFWAEYRNDPRSRQFTPVIVHADLNPDHVLIDPATGEVTGVIDFGDACIGDPAIDFAGFPEEIVASMLATYGRDGPGLLHRSQVLARAIPLHAIHFGALVRDETILSAGLAELALQLGG